METFIVRYMSRGLIPSGFPIGVLDALFSRAI